MNIMRIDIDPKVLDALKKNTEKEIGRPIDSYEELIHILLAFHDDGNGIPCHDK